jgi:ketosteroid isomerase-like protein
MVNPDQDQRPSPDAQDEHDLREANAEWARALAQRDGAALARVMADEFVLAYPFEGEDKDQFVADILNGELKVESLEPHGVTFRISAGTGVVFGSETANWYYRGRDLSGPYRFLRVYTKQSGRWQIVALHLCLPVHR